MSFLSKSKKNPPPSGLPQATRKIHTSEGTAPPPAVIRAPEKSTDRIIQTSPQGGSVNDSNNSLAGSTLAASSINGPGLHQPRNRSESDSGVSCLKWIRSMYVS